MTTSKLSIEILLAKDCEPMMIVYGCRPSDLTKIRVEDNAILLTIGQETHRIDVEADAIQHMRHNSAVVIADPSLQSGVRMTFDAM